MIECENCGFWFHPECLGFWGDDLEYLELQRIYCFYCKINTKIKIDVDVEVKKTYPKEEITKS